MTGVLTTTQPLTAVDRCDRCGAQAYIRATLPGGGSELLFCGHHGRKHVPALQEAGASIHDESDRLNETPAIADEAER